MNRDLFNSVVTKKRKTYVSDHYGSKSKLKKFNNYSNQNINRHHQRIFENESPPSRKVDRNFIYDESESETDAQNDSMYELRAENGSGGSEIDTSIPFSYEGQQRIKSYGRSNSNGIESQSHFQKGDVCVHLGHVVIIEHVFDSTSVDCERKYAVKRDNFDPYVIGEHSLSVLKEYTDVDDTREDEYNITLSKREKKRLKQRRKRFRRFKDKKKLSIVVTIG